MPDARELNFGNIPRTDQPRKLNFGSIPFMEPESPYDDSALGAAKRIGGSLVEYGAALPTGLQTTISAVNRLIGRPIQRLAGAFDPELEKGLRASEAQGFETARKIRESAKQFSEKTLGAKPGTPITIENLKKESLGGKIGMLARGTVESVPVTLVNLGMTLLNPAVGAASVYLAEAGGTRANLDELEKSGVKIDPAYKDIASVGGGALKTALEQTGLESLVSKAPGARSKVFNILSSLLTEFKTEGVQELADVLTEAGAKVSGDDSLKVFETFKSEIENNLPRLEEASIRGGLAGGAIRGGVEALRILGERTQAKKAEQEKSIQTAEEEARLVEQAKTARENLKVQSERESLLDRLQKERDLEVGGPLVGADEQGFRRPEVIDQDIQKRLSEIPEEQIPSDPTLRKLLDEKKLIIQAGEFDLADFKPAEAPVEKPIVPVSERELRAEEYLGEDKAAELEKEGVSIFDYKRSLSAEELANLDAAQARLDIAAREFASKLYSGPAFSPQIWKEYVEIGHLVAKGLARNLGEKAKITFENFKEAFKNAVGPDLFKRLESHLAHLWEQVKTLPDDWKSGDEVPGVVRAEAVENTPDAKDAPRAYEKKERQFNFGLPLLDRLERSNRVGVQMAQAWKKAHGILKTTLGKYAVEIRNVAKEAGVRRDQTTPHLDVIAAGDEKRGRNLLLVELINNPEKRNNYPLTETEKKILSLYDKMATEFDAKISKLIGKEPSGKPKFSPTLNNEAREALFVLKGGPLFEAIAKAVANRSGIELNKVKQKLASGNLSGLDIPTHVNLKGNLVAIGSADAISALQALNFEHARALGLLRTFGPKWKNRLKEIREVYDRQDGDLETFDLIEQAYRGLRPKDWASEKQASRNLAYRLLFRAADPILTSLALSKSAYMQITQPFIDLQNVGVKNFVKTYRELFGGKIKADDLERMGLISRDLLNWKFAEGEKLEDYSRMISALVNRGDLMHAVSLLNDVVAATHWRNYVNSLVGKKLGAEERQTLKVNLGLTDAEIKKVEQGKFQDPLGENPSTPEEEFFVEMVRRGKTQSQHTGKFGGEKSKFQTGSTAPFFLKFQNYTIGEFQRWRRETENVAKALKEGDEGERNAAIMRMLKLVGITSLQGELINIIRHTIKGEWDEADESSAVAQLAKENYAQAAKNFLWNFAEAGFMGAFTRAYLAYNIAQGSAGALLDLTLPTNIIHELWDMAGRRGKYADKTTGERIERFLETRVPASDLPRAGKRALALMGLAKEDGHKTDVATRAYFKWLEDTGRQKDFPEKEGYVESRRNFLLAYRALNSGDDEEVMPLLIKGFDAKILENERMTPKEALGRLKASLGARMRVLKKDKGRLVSRFDKKTTEDLKKEIGEEKYDLLVAHDTRLNRLLESLYVTNKHLVRRK